MLRDFSFQAAFMGFLAAFAGFASSFAVILHGLTAVGASTDQAATGLMVSALAMGLAGVFLAGFSKNPLSCAWTTPGAAFLAATGVPEGGFPVAVGAFIMTAIALTACGFIRPLGRLVAHLPDCLANALLGGILLTLCFAPFKAIAFDPLLGLPIFATWVVVGAFKRLLAAPAALIAFVLVVTFGVERPQGAFVGLAAAGLPPLHWIQPEFTLAGVIGLAMPLFIITMASQNIPGIAAMRSFGYPLRPGLWFTTTGIASFITAPLGGVAVNLAAITAAMCAGEDAHPDPKRRYWSAIVAGLFYCLFGLLAGFVTSFVALAPPILIQAVAGLALIGAFSNATLAAFSNPKDREAAAVTFLMTAAGVTIAGISGAFWGLVAGGAVFLLKRRFAPPSVSP